jgi:hypothetical protein
MTVQELIEKLKELDADLEVFCDGDRYSELIDTVEKRNIFQLENDYIKKKKTYKIVPGIFIGKR